VKQLLNIELQNKCVLEDVFFVSSFTESQSIRTPSGGLCKRQSVVTSLLQLQEGLRRTDMPTFPI
jgi:hypothetical protein